MSEGTSEINSSEIKKSFVDTNKDRPADEKLSRIDRLGKFILSRKELLPFALIGGADLTREIITRDPLLTPKALLTTQYAPPENISAILSHGGGVYDAYTISMLTYYGISLLAQPVKDKVSTNVKVAVASLVGLSAVVANELGVGGGTPDLADIPAGVLGAMIFAGVMSLNKQFIKDCTAAIKELKEKSKKGKISQETDY